MSSGLLLPCRIKQCSRARSSRASRHAANEPSPAPWIPSLESDGGVGGSNVIRVSHDDDEPDLYRWHGADWAFRYDDVASDADFEFVANARQEIPAMLAALNPTE
jgi:hypothetical protein